MEKKIKIQRTFSLNSLRDRMGQKDILDFLEQEYKKDPNKTFKQREIAKGLGKNIFIRSNYLYRPLNQLWRKGEVYCERKNGKLKEYRHKPSSKKIVVEGWNGRKGTVKIIY